ncbi:5'-nucleotidase SurE [Planctomycetales bacterium 10988]|nr:5'-nucleotidase SurE [Planctomycetales bacterium 10988]
MGRYTPEEETFRGNCKQTKEDVVLILLTNDDGIYAPGLRAMEQALQTLGEVVIVAPSTEQSGVGHSITFLQPLVAHEVFDGERKRGWAVEGSPADCVKLALFEYCPRQPDLIVSGINNGLNAGINILYSGTVAAAIEGAFFGIQSVAVSLEFDEHANFEGAAHLAQQIIGSLVDHPEPPAQLFNLNIPTAALSMAERDQFPEVTVAPMGVARYGEHYEKRTDPRGRDYFWATNDPPPPRTGEETDLLALSEGKITLTPLHFDMTQQPALKTMRSWKWDVNSSSSE